MQLNTRATHTFVAACIAVTLCLFGNAHGQCTRCPGSGGAPITIHSFSGPDGANPVSGVVRDAAGNLYGTTQQGGTSNLGTVFKLDTAGNESVLHNFAGYSPDGAYPFAGLLQDSAGNLYGTTTQGGSSNAGTVFKLDTSGHESVLYSFTGAADGGFPKAGLTQDAAGDFYGTTSAGGGMGKGVVFKLDTTGNETVLHNFAGGTADGFDPEAGLVQDSAGNLYGTTVRGGSGYCGTISAMPPQKPTPVPCGIVFKLDAAGNETVLHNFSGYSEDGASPYGTLVRDAAGNLYGATYNGGAVGCIVSGGMPGTISVVGCGMAFKINATGQETVLHNFGAASTEGTSPQTGLVEDSNGNLYGTTFSGGLANMGTVFRLDTSGNEVVLYNFMGTGGDGANPQAGLTLDAQGNLYGTTLGGGSSGIGTVFMLPAASAGVSVLLSGNGTGTVTSNPAGISCGSSCSAAFLNGTTVQLKASPAASSNFSGWAGACSGSGLCYVTVGAIQAVTASFNTRGSDFSLTTSAFSPSVLSPGGSSTATISVTGEGGFNGPVVFSCSVQPSPTLAPTCSISPSLVTPGASAILTVGTTAPTAGLVLSTPQSGMLYSLLLPVLGVIVAGIGSSSTRKLKARILLTFLMCVLASGVVFEVACGGGGTSSGGGASGSPAGTYTVTVTGSAGTLQHSTTTTLTVQ